MFDSCPLDLPPYRGFVAAVHNGPELTAVLRSLPELLFSASAEILQDGRNKIYAVRFPQAHSSSGKDGGFSKPADGEAVVKIFGARGFHQLKTLLLPSKGIRAWRGAVALRESGFETPFPIAAYERRRFGVVVESVFVAERIRGGQEIRGLFRDLPEPELRALIAGLAPVLAGLHNAGLVHRDLSDGNIFVIMKNEVQSSKSIINSSNLITSTPLTSTSGSPFSPDYPRDNSEFSDPKTVGDAYLHGVRRHLYACAPESEKDGFRRGEFPDLQFHFLDTNRVRKRLHLGTFSQARNLVRLGVPASLRSFFLDQYALAAGPSFPRTRFAFYYRTAKRTFEFWLAFKKALRLRTIARKLGLQ